MLVKLTYTPSQTRPPARIAWVFAALIAFTLQSLVAVSHLHLASPDSAVSCIAADTGTLSVAVECGSADTAAGCALCHAMALSHGAIANTSLHGSILSQKVDSQRAALGPQLLRAAFSFHWDGRAPPSADLF